MFNRDVYDYEVSIWTLQDGFITVLKPSETEIKGQIQDGKVLIKDDGTREFSFAIPMYLYKGNERFENPAWYNTTNGNILVNLRKLKVIFNKKTRDEKVFEFLITKVTEEHQNGTLICRIESEGLAFHELGKIGYQISLSSDDFVDDYNTWVANGGENSDKEEPISNINYWCDKVFSYIIGWTYEVQMDWRGYYTTVMENDKLINFARDSHTIYEDAISILGPDTEKCRLLDIEESNVYNITQTIAELFGVFCRYEYSYDGNYHIIGKKVVFYNNFLKESEGAYDLTYPYSTSDISREINSTDVVTKLFVRPLQDANTATGLIDIIDVKENITKENYILNFEYLHDIGTITEEQYQAVKTYQDAMRYYNEKLIPLESEIVSLQAQKPLIESQVTFSINAMRLDQQQLDTQNDLLNSLTGETGVISRGLTNPEQLLLREDKNNTTATEKVYFVNLTQHGIDPATLQLYKTYQVTNTGTSVDGEAHTRVSDRINTGQFEYDDYGDLVRVSNIYSDSAGYIYAVYDYDPRVYYERVVETWTNRLDQDIANYNLNEQKRLDLIARLNTLIDEQTLLIKEKEDTIAAFNKMMGAALREGYWQPEDYTDYKDRYLNYYNFNPTVAEITSSRTNEFDSFVWDATPFEGEQSLYTEIGVDQKKYTYPCIDLTAGNLPNIFSDPTHIQQLSFLFYDFDNFTTSGSTSNVNAGRLRNFTIGSKCQYGFLKRPNNVIKPVLILTGMETVPNYKRQYPTAFSWWRANAALMVNNKDVYVVDNLENWDMYRLALPAGSRIKITSLTRNSAIKGVLPMAYEYNNYYYPLDLNEVGETITADALLINYLRTTDEYSIESVGYDITGAPFATPEANVIGYLGALTVEKINNVNTVVKADWSQSVPREAWIEPTEEDELVFPRIRIKSLSLQDDENNLQLYYNNSTEPLKKYEDYSVLIRTDEEAGTIPDTIDYITSNYITIKPNILLRGGINSEVNTRLSISYAISNANLSIYLDALQISKENAYPKVSYSVMPNVFDSKFLRTLYARLSQIVHINDTDLHLKYVQGYISELDLDLDHPWNSSVEVKNYKNKFEDLFSTIVAQTEAMKKTSGTIYNISQVVSGGSITGSALQSSLIKVDLNYAFNNGTLTINEKDGIWGVSDAGVVAFRGGGIFLANEKDGSGNWIWNTGLVPQGINANLITSGQLDTNRVMIYAGDKLRFQFNSDGLFAYKSFFEDLSIDFNNQETPLDPTDTPWFTKELNVEEVNKALRDGLGIDGAQYVKFDSNGVFFNLKKGALVLNEKKTDYITIGKYYYTYEREVGVDANGKDIVTYIITPHDSNDPEYGSRVATIPEEFSRVSLTWDGFTLRNYNGERIFYISAESGDIFMKGNLFASDLHIVNGNGDLILFDDYLDLSTEEIVQGIIDNVQAHLMSISDKVDLLNEDFTESLAYANELLSHIPVNLLEIDNKINLLAADFQDSLDEGNKAIDQIQENLQTINGRIDELAEDFEESIADANDAINGIQVNLLEINTKIDSLNAEFDSELADAQQALTTNINTQIQTINAHVDSLAEEYDASLEYLNGLIVDVQGEIDDIEQGTQLVSEYYHSNTVPVGYKAGDIWKPNTRLTYLAASSEHSSSDNEETRRQDWVLISDEGFISGAELTIDADTGVIQLLAENEIKLTSGDLKLTGSHLVQIGGGTGVAVASGGYINLVSSSNSNINAIEMNSNGIALRSSGIIDIHSTNDDSKSVIKISAADGVKIGSTEKVTFFATEGIASSSSSAVELSKDRILFGVSAGNGITTAVDVDKDGIVITTQGIMNNSTVSAFSPLSTAGMKITNQLIGMSVTTTIGNNTTAKNLFWMDQDGIEIGSLSTSTTSGLKAVNVSDGSYALIKRTDGIEFGTINNYGASIVSMRSQRVLVAARTGNTKTLSSTTYYPISVMDIQGEKLAFVSGLSAVDVQKKFSDDGAANTANTFNPRDSRLSGFRMTSTDLGISLTTQNGTSSNYPTAKSLFWIDKDGIEMGSVGASNDASQSALLNGSYVFIKNSNGVEIGAAPANSDGSIASFRQTGRALFAARANSKVGVVDIQPTKVVITAGASNTTIPQNFGTTGIAATSNSFDPRGTNAISGIRIQQENLGMAVVGSGSGKSLFWLDGDGLELGSVSSTSTAPTQTNLLNGAYVFIKHNSGVEIGAAPASTDGTVASIRKTGRALFAARANSSTSVVDIQPTKVVIAAGSSNKTVPKNFADDTTGDISYDSDNFDPRTDTTGISGVRIRQTDLGMAIVGNSKNPGKSLFWMDKDGLELGTINTKSVASAQTQTLETSDLLTGSYVFIKNQHGVEIGSGNTGTDGGIVSIQQQRVAIAVGNSANASIIDMVDGKVIITSGSRFARNFANLSNSYDAFDPLSSDKSGVRITKEDIGMAVISGSLKNLIWMDSSGVEIGSVDANTDRTSSANKIDKAKGGYVLIKHADGVEIGGGTITAAGIIQLTPNGTIHIQHGIKTDSNSAAPNYAALNLGSGAYAHGFEAEVSGILSIKKRVASGTYGLNILSNGKTQTTMTLCSWDSNWSPVKDVTKANIKLVLQANSSETAVIAVNNINDSTLFRVETTGNVYATFTSATGTQNTAPSATATPSPGSSTTTYIRDTIQSYTTDSNYYVTSITLASGKVLNFNRPASGISLNDVIPSISVSGANANLILSATGQTSRTVTPAWKLRLYNPNDTANINSSIILDITGTDSGTSANSMAIGLNEYWQIAQKATDVALVENSNIDDNAKKVKIRRIPNDSTSDTDWLATLVYDTTNNKVLLTSNGTTSGVKYAEISVNGSSSSITVTPGLQTRSTNPNGNTENGWVDIIATDSNGNITVAQNPAGMWINLTSNSTYFRTANVNLTMNNVTYATLPLQNYWDTAQNKVNLLQNSNTVGATNADIVYLRKNNGLPESTTANNNDTQVARLHLVHSTRDNSSYDDTSNIILSSNINNTDLANESSAGTIYARLNLTAYWNIAQSKIQVSSISLTENTSSYSSNLYYNGTITLNNNNSYSFSIMHAHLSSSTYYVNKNYSRADKIVFKYGRTYTELIQLNEYWDAAQSAVTVAFNAPTTANLNDTVAIVKNSTLTTVTAKLYQDGDTVYLSADGTSSTVKYAKLSITGGSSTHSPTFTVANVTGAGTQPHSFNIMPSCSGTNGTTVAYTMAITASFTSTVTSISAKTTNFSRSDRVTLLQSTNIIRNAYFNLSSYWDAAQSNSNLALVTPKDSSSYYITANNDSSPGNTPTQDSSIAILASTVSSSATTVTTSNVLKTIGLSDYWNAARATTQTIIWQIYGTDAAINSSGSYVTREGWKVYYCDLKAEQTLQYILQSNSEFNNSNAYYFAYGTALSVGQSTKTNSETGTLTARYLFINCDNNNNKSISYLFLRKILYSYIEE